MLKNIGKSALVIIWLIGLYNLIGTRYFSSNFSVILGAFLISSLVVKLLVVGADDAVTGVEDER